MRITTRLSLLAAFGAALIGAAALWAVDPEAGSGPLPKLRPARDTTFLIAPLDDDGNVDYAAALNEVYGRDVKPEQNGLVGLWQAWGPNALGEPPAPEYFDLLGMSRPPDEGKYLVDFSAYVREGSGDDAELADRLHRQHFDSTEKPWTARRQPGIAAWVVSNEAPLAVVAEAVRREKYFRPILHSGPKSGEMLLFAMRAPESGLLLELARLLVCRANLHMGEGRLAAAAEDVLTCRRLGRMIARGPAYDDAAVGFVVDAYAVDAERTLVRLGGRSTAELRRYLDELKSLGPLPWPGEVFTRADRYCYLDAVQRIREQKSDAVLAHFPLKNPARATRIDFEAALRSGNYWFDRVSGARRRLLFDPPRGTAQLEKLREELTAIRKKFPERDEQEGHAIDRVADEDFSDYLLATFFPDSGLAPFGNFDRWEQEFELSKLAAALMLFRVERNRYPATLDELAPAYLKSISRDRYTGAPLVYRIEADGCVLYSVGPNGRDDGGVNKTDRLDDLDERFDDRVVRMTAAP